MPKTRAEIQKANRERKKEENRDAWLQKERSRVNKYYVPSGELGERKRRQRNERNRARNQLSRSRKQERWRALTA